MIVAGSQAAAPPPVGAAPGSSAGNCLYVGLNKEHRVSRTFRATWYLKTYSALASTSIQQGNVPESEGEDIQVLGMCGGSGLNPHTQVFYVCQQYSLVFVLDMSSNMRAVSNGSYCVKLDEAVTALCNCLTLLTQPFAIEANSGVFESELCVTVLGFCGSTADKPVHVFIQGVCVDSSNCSHWVTALKEDIIRQENLLASTCHKTRLDVGGAGDVTLETMLRVGTLGIQLLPRSALKGVVLLTDGISGFPTASAMHNMVANMSSSNISCWVVQVGGNPHLSDPLGLIPDMETLNFVTRACNGCVIQPHKVAAAVELLAKPCPQEGGVAGPNAVQEAVLLWSFQLPSLAHRVRGVVGEGWEVPEDPFVPIIHRVFRKSTVIAQLLCVLGCKIREGFYLKYVQVKDVVVEVCLCYLWQPSVNIYYTITAPWPVSEERELLQVTTSYDGPYSFVHDFQCDTNPQTLTSYRATAIRKFKQALQKFSNSDALLAHFLSFPSMSSLHQLPASVQDGAPLFHSLPNSSKPAPSITVNTPGGKATPLHQFWRPLCTVDTSQWYRWFHSDKLVLVLRPEFPLPRNLLEKSATGRYGTPLCRPAASHLFDFLKGWSSLVLLEGLSYIRWLPFSAPHPCYFCVVRVAHKYPCVVLHVGYIEGTPHTLQADTVASLLDGLKRLALPTTDRGVGGAGKRKPAVVVAKGGPVVTVLGKQLQRVMIRYDSMGSTPPSSSSSLVGMSAGAESAEKLTQMDYLQRYRCKWLVPSPSAHILTVLLKCRLQEGYQVISAHNGVVTLAAQLTLQQQSCASRQKLLLQYVIFPFGKTLTSELWVEPQCGVVCEAPPELQYLEGLNCQQIASEVHAVDQVLVTQVTSFVHLLHTCQAGQSTCETGQLTDDSQEVGVADKSKGVTAIEFQLTSLFAKSSVCAVTMTAFSEDMSGAESWLLGDCSAVNTGFWQCLTSHLQAMAPTAVSLSDHASIINRLQLSSKLSGLLTAIHLQEHAQWTCAAMATNDNDLTVFLLPQQLYRDCGGGGRGVALLPVIVLQCYQEQLLNSDLEDPPLPEDLYLHFDLAPSSAPADVSSSLKELLSQLSSLHTSCFLEQVNSALTQHLALSREDFLRGVAVCQTSTLSVDMTPLLSGLCQHCLTSLPASPHLDPATVPLSSEVLSQLLSAVLSRLMWTCVVQRVEGSGDWGRSEDGSSCHLHTQLVNQALRTHLHQLGFRVVSQCGHTHFWLDSSDQLKAEPLPPHATPPQVPAGLVPVEEEEEEAYPELKQGFAAEASSSEDEQDMLLVPLLSPPGEELGDGRAGGGVPAAPPPLFLRIACCVRDSAGADKREVSVGDTCCLSTCLATLLADVGKGSHTVSVELIFSSLSEDAALSVDHTHQHIELATLPRCHHHLALGLQSYLQWLICDELVSVGHSALPISPGLLQGVASHIQTTHNSLESCFTQHVPLKFVFGAQHSMSYFSQQLEGLSVPGYQLLQLEDYYYLKASPRLSSSLQPGELTPDLMSSESDVRLPSGQHNYEQSCEPAFERSRTPPPPQLAPLLKGHKRSMSSGYACDHSPKFQVPSLQASVCGSEDLSTVDVSGYEAGSDDGSSLSEAEKASPVSVESQAWVVLRVLSNQVDLYFQLRSSEQLEGQVWAGLREVCDRVLRCVQRCSHRTNQWLLMKAMLDTRVCSPYLLSESASEAWVEEAALMQQGRRESFRAQEFMCELVHRNFITPHWRVRDMKGQAALLITRSALSAFAVTNRRDVYVFEDVSASGEESIFYVKVDESLCNVENSPSAGTEASVPLERRDTIDGAADETQSTFSYQQSLLSEVPEPERRPTGVEVLPFLTSGSKPQESLVVQVYGISKPSQEFKDRLNGTIQHKLEATTLEILCGHYSRSQNLRLTPEDIEFLQPDRKASHTLHLSLPKWLHRGNQHPFFFYFLQSMSSFCLRPLYMYAGSSSTPKQLQAHEELHNAYLVEGFAKEGKKDHLFLYIRPHTKGRGMAVLCVSLADSSGRVQAPQPQHMTPLQGGGGAEVVGALQGGGGAEVVGALRKGEDWLKCELSEEMAVSGSPSIKFHVWEKGNIGLEEFLHKLSRCFVHTALDHELELCLLSRPVAQHVHNWEELVDHDMLVCGSEATPTVGGARDSPVPQSPDKELLGRHAPTISTDTPKKKVSVVSYKSSSSSRSRKSSDSMSRKGSAQPQPESRRGSAQPQPESRRSSSQLESRRGSAQPESRRGSALASEARKMTRLGPEFRQDSSVLSESSRKSSLSEMRRASGEKGGAASEEVWSHQDVIEEAEERSSVASSLGSLELGRSGVLGEEDSQSPWLQKEKERRIREAVELLVRDAELGKCGLLSETYSSVIPHRLSLAHENGSPSVQYASLPLLGHYSTKTFVSEALKLLEGTCGSNISDVFQRTPAGYLHVQPARDWAKVRRKVASQLHHTHFILLNRNRQQWEQCCYGNTDKQSLQQQQQDSSCQQLFSGLDSGRLSSDEACPPLLAIAEAREVFIPRRMFVLMRVSETKSEVWLYNMSDQCSKAVLQKLRVLREQLATRSGLLHHMLAQKMGLYRHCMGQDLRDCTKLALTHCSTVLDVVKVIKNTLPAHEVIKPVLTRRPAYEHLSIEGMYQDQPPYGPVGLSEDPVYNHGHQFRDWHSRHHREVERVTLLGKVFRSWLSREGDASVPVSPEVIASLKRTARLLHYCTSPLLIQATPISDKDEAWLETMKDEVLSLYVEYLLMLGFQVINERVLKPSSQPSSQSVQSVAPPYKCLQRSWPGGIIMAELSFQDQVFAVKLYTLEGSRLLQSSPLSPESRSHFARECARYKDFIHVHSFMHDYHLRFLLDLLNGKWPSLKEFNLCAYMELCHAHYNPLPNFAQNLLKKECLCVPTSVPPEQLYLHLVSHCKEFGTTTVELQVAGSPSAKDIGLLLNIDGESLTTPELCELMKENKGCYSSKVLALYNPSSSPSSSGQQLTLQLKFYLLLVNTEEKFPCLVSDCPELTASRHALPPTAPEALTEGDRDLKLKVKEHRRRMGYGLMATPTASRHLLHQDSVECQVHAVRTHLETVITRALHHMRKDELWKRLLYGASFSSEGKSLPLNDLVYSDFRDLLHLVTESPLDSLDPRLSQLKKQPRKWFKKLFKALKLRFTENIRIYSTDDESHTYAAIINPDWQDMLVLVHSSADGKHQGLSAVYRKPREGGLPRKERHIAANLEADVQHIETVVNFCCSFMWASILDAAPPLPQLNLL